MQPAPSPRLQCAPSLYLCVLLENCVIYLGGRSVKGSRASRVCRKPLSPPRHFFLSFFFSVSGITRSLVPALVLINAGSQGIPPSSPLASKGIEGRSAILAVKLRHSSQMLLLHANTRFAAVQRGEADWAGCVQQKLSMEGDGGDLGGWTACHHRQVLNQTMKIRDM